ncbi:hypothetical protein TNCV_3925061 [Trichonephila clavipes]|nr:hypothetical protein TNCV_3925061 [Trichonephila clavipes]
MILYAVEPLGCLELACLQRRWIDGYKWIEKGSPGHGINSKKVVLSPGRKGQGHPRALAFAQDSYLALSARK